MKLIHLYTTQTKLYVTEHCEVREYKDGHPIAVSHGKYTWQNRPWQKFEFEQAIIKAVKEAVDLTEHEKEALSNFTSLSRCIEYVNDFLLKKE